MDTAFSVVHKNFVSLQIEEILWDQQVSLFLADDQRLKEGGLHLAKDEVLAVVLYVQVWQQRYEPVYLYVSV